ncbi:MAG: hypothetical protein IMZ65_02785 [Planctomycetes bacterium]|nr:hypothetical protein [Planctomycetota bacterium]
MADSSLPSTERMNPAALTAEDVARLLGAPVAVVEKDLAEGAPRAADGTMNLVHYAAWLLKDMANGD